MTVGDANGGDATLAAPAQAQDNPGSTYEASTRLYNDAVGIRTASSFPIGDGTVGAMAPQQPMDTQALDKNKSISQLMREGVIRRSEISNPTDAAAVPAQATDAAVDPRVTVTYADNTDPSKLADIIVRKDGTVEATSDFDPAQKKNVVVQVERSAGDLSDVTGAQKASLDSMVTYLNDRMNLDPSLKAQGVKLDDQYGLLSDNVVKKFVGANETPDSPQATAAEARRDFSPETQNAMSRMSRMTPGSSGSMSRSDIDNNFAPRDVPTLKGETDTVIDTKNAISAMFNPDKAAPYETVRQRANGDVAVGRYGANFLALSAWFKSLTGVDEINEGNVGGVMDKLSQKGKISKEFAAKFKDKEFAKGFVKILDGMKHGEKPTAEQLKMYFPKDMQEQVAMDLVNQFSKAANGDVGKTALGFHLGKSPDTLTEAELNDRGNKEFMQAADRLAKLANKSHNMGENDRLDWTVNKDGSMFDAKVLQSAQRKANQMDRTGLCATGVQLAWSDAGYKKLLGTGDGWEMRHALSRNSDFQMTNWEGAQAAAKAGNAVIVTRQWAGSPNGAGHVATLSYQNGRMMEASDHITTFNKNNQRYGKDLFFVYVGDKKNNTGMA